jgi:hypothetical protein
MPKGEAMFNARIASGSLSQTSLRVGVASLVSAIVLALCEGHLRGPGGLNDNVRSFEAVAWISMAASCCYSLRNVAEIVTEAAAIVFIGAKFLEVRGTLSVGFDKLDSDKVTITGPDDNNIVWIGRRYRTRLEAESVAVTLASQLHDGGEQAP